MDLKVGFGCAVETQIDDKTTVKNYSNFSVSGWGLMTVFAMVYSGGQYVPVPTREFV